MYLKFLIIQKPTTVAQIFGFSSLLLIKKNNGPIE